MHRVDSFRPSDTSPIFFLSSNPEGNVTRSHVDIHCPSYSPVRAGLVEHMYFETALLERNVLISFETFGLSNVPGNAGTNQRASRLLIRMIFDQYPKSPIPAGMEGGRLIKRFNPPRDFALCCSRVGILPGVPFRVGQKRTPEQADCSQTQQQKQRQFSARPSPSFYCSTCSSISQSLQSSFLDQGYLK